MTAFNRDPCIVFVTTCKGRLPHLERTLPQNMADNRDYPACRFVVLDYDSPDDLAGWVGRFQAAVPDGRLVCYSYRNGGAPFHMAHAKNMAHRCGLLEGADVLVNVDADNFTGRGFARFVAGRFRRNPNVFLWANRNQPDPLRYPKGCNGRIAVSADWFLKSGGYNEKYSQWGPDDKDFHFRLRRFGLDACEIPRQYLEVILHHDKMRFREYPEALEAAVSQPSDFQAVSETDTIANFGTFGCGRVYRDFAFSSPVDLAPLPTRIFGIGMHKTATTSLDRALTLLGYDSAHWLDAHWARAIWDQMTATGRSSTLERHYAVCDLPITLLYRELDRGYPGSRFILTVRDEVDWLRSARDHWDRRRNPYRDAWDTDPVTHRLHRALYGRKKFDALVFLERYRRHNREVAEYFAGRDDLLVMDMDGHAAGGHAAGWPELCRFLGRPVPAGPFPRRLVTPGPDAERDGSGI